MGKYFEELQPNDRIIHSLSKTITEGEHFLFCSMTLNSQPLHIDKQFASQSVFGDVLVNGLFTLSLVIGITVHDLTSGTIVANLSYDNILHPKPVFHGDTIRVETQILNKRPSKSKPHLGLITMKHFGINQKNEIVVEVTRTALFKKKIAESNE